MTGADPHGVRTPQDVPDLTLAEFLLARLDEDERVAQIAAAAARFPTWHQGATSDDDVVYPAGDLTDPGRCSEHPAGQPNMCDDNPAIGVDPDFVSDRNAPLIAEHIARHDPARVLRDVAAKRRIVADMADVHLSRAVAGTTRADLAVLRLLAEVYADHAEWREEWRP